MAVTSRNEDPIRVQAIFRLSLFTLYIQGAPGQPDKYSLVQRKHCSITISNCRFNGCLILTSFVGGKHLQLLESSTQFLRDFRNYFLAKRKSPYQYIQPLKQLVLPILLLMYS
ncbi:hypothetical protein HanRHA438_Chr04g0172061 [Helianthus annuus]|uniref:Uncharacterized protein n=1 Tax=Helianthus annuus TaxID=4232 RepID=A0A9K3J6V4_HELAN|nr:hypothetical protein HanXRQr2_Chr04g0161931 [Helianthus annuus]KAJ0580783.1 hypothetical protein HanHA300_Chr04g0133321 [Helianthus annuus]KAJ0588470.1 hypothetical protein HanIR_Chr04g0175031 [Helianthus annuus]KAJ0596731.1 hypothetical protein HanHA89_Chr04g0146271 [Helianthus annuus]KAJ0757403.1 hypothetical protein HanLR1_Chr04g0138321 [Helianthus annuus]